MESERRGDDGQSSTVLNLDQTRLGRVSRAAKYLFAARTIWIVDAHRGDGRRFIVRADEKLTAFVELERQVSTVTFYLEAIRNGDQWP